MKRPYSYSGLTLSNLARSLGKPFPQWYDQVYGPQSEHVHAADLLQHVEVDEDATTRARWHSSIDEIRHTLRTGIAMFYETIGMLDHQIGFGVGPKNALAAFAREYQTLVIAESD